MELLIVILITVTFFAGVIQKPRITLGIVMFMQEGFEIIGAMVIIIALIYKRL